MDDTNITSLKTGFDATMATARAFMESRAILTAVELDLFTAVCETSSASSVAHKIGTDPRATEMLMNVLVTQGLLKKAEDRYALTPVAEKYLTSTSPDSARDAIMHTVGLWNSWSTLTAAVRAGTSVAKRRRNAEETEAFIAAMHRNSLERASVVAGALGIARYENMLDVGGGSGGYSITFARMNPALRSVVFDLGQGRGSGGPRERQKRRFPQRSVWKRLRSCVPFRDLPHEWPGGKQIAVSEGFRRFATGW